MILLNGKELNFTQFPNGETNVPHKQIKSLYAYGHTNIITLKYENDVDLIRLMFIKKHLDKLTNRIKLVIAYMPYSRMDRVENDSVFTLKYVAEFINSLNFSEQTQIVEPHSDVTPALINNAVEVYPTVKIFHQVKDIIWFNKDKDYVYYPDAGAEKRYSKKIGNLKSITGFKKRDFETGQITSLEIMGKIEGNPKIIMIDDLCSYGGTFMLGATKLREIGVSSIHLIIGHCENSIYKGDILKTRLIDEVYTTDSILTDMSSVKPNGKISIFKL